MSDNFAPSDPRHFMNTSPNFDFTDPKTRHDRIIIVEGQKFYVQIGLLSVWSEYFYALLNSGLKEADQNEVTIEEVKADDFKNFLMLVYPMKFNITEKSVIALLLLSHRFLAPRVQEECEKYITINMAKMDSIDMLLVAHQYDMKELMDKLVNHMKKETMEMIVECTKCRLGKWVSECRVCNDHTMQGTNFIAIGKKSYLTKNSDRIFALPTDLKDFIFKHLLTFK